MLHRRTPGVEGWAVGDHLTANVIDRLSDLIEVFIRANSDKSREPQEPERMPRPGDAARRAVEKRRTDADRAAALHRVRELESIVLAKEVL